MSASTGPTGRGDSASVQERMRLERRRAAPPLALWAGSACERAAEIAPTRPDTDLIRRMEESNFRQLQRLTGIILRSQRQEIQLAKLTGNGPSRDV